MYCSVDWALWLRQEQTLHTQKVVFNECILLFVDVVCVIDHARPYDRQVDRKQVNVHA